MDFVKFADICSDEFIRRALEVCHSRIVGGKMLLLFLLGQKCSKYISGLQCLMPSSEISIQS